jgi:glutamine synthetase
MVPLPKALNVFPDLLDNAAAATLRRHGALIAPAGHRIENLPPENDGLLIVRTSAAGPDNPEVAEATRRGLPNLPDTRSAIQPLRDPANQKVFAAYGVLTEGELASRYEIALEDYHRRIRIEGSVALDIARSMVRPVVADEFSKLATALSMAKKDGLKTGIAGLKALSVRLGAGLDDLHVKCERLDKALAKGTHEDQIAAMRDLRHTVDALEHLVDDARWPLPKYREMLFIY